MMKRSPRAPNAHPGHGAALQTVIKPA